MLYYLSGKRLPGADEAIDDKLKRANAIQQMNMCEAFTNATEEVCFVSPKTAGREPSWDTVSEFYGLCSEFDLKGISSPPWDFFKTRSIPNTDSQTVTAWLIYSYLTGGFEDGDIIFSRNLHPTRYFLKFLDRIDGGPDITIWYAQHQVGQDMDEYVDGGGFYTQLDKLVVVSERQKQRVVETHSIDPESVFVAHDGVDLDRYDDLTTADARDRLGFDQNEDIVMYTGHLYPGKDVETLVEAAANFDAQCYIVGGYEEDISRIRETVTVPENVTFTGFLSPNEIVQYQAAADILVATVAEDPDQDYFSPLKLFEYMAAEKPVVVSHKPSYEEVLTDREDALLVAPGSVSELTSSVKTLLADRELRTELAEQARTTVEQYGWNERAEQIVAEAATDKQITEQQEDPTEQQDTPIVRSLTPPIQQLVSVLLGRR